MSNRDLTPEGQKLFESIFSYDELVNKGFRPKSDQLPPPPQNTKLNKWEQEILALKLELAKMIANSKLVIEDCDAMLESLETVEDYIKSDAKVAKSLHHNLINRLQRVIVGLPAFEDESHLTLNVKGLRNEVIKLMTSR